MPADGRRRSPRPRNWRAAPGRRRSLAPISSGRRRVAAVALPAHRAAADDEPSCAQAAGERCLAGRAGARRRSRVHRGQGRCTSAAQPAVQVLATSASAASRRVRSTHIYADGAEIVVDAYAPPSGLRARGQLGLPAPAAVAATARAELERGMSRRARWWSLDACGVGACRDAADYGDAGADTLGAPRRGRRRARPADARAPRPRVDRPDRRRAAGGRARRSTAACTRRPGQGLDDRALGAHGRRSRARRRPTRAASRPRSWRAGARPPAAACSATPRATASRRSSASASDHLRTGELIVYTSQDSVLQIAAHVDVVAAPTSSTRCARGARAMTGEHAVGPRDRPARSRARRARSRARGPPRLRAARRRAASYLDALGDAGVPVHARGQGRRPVRRRGIDARAPGADERGGARRRRRALLRELDDGLVFANLIETDQVYGHRKDVEGFHGALREIDARGRRVARAAARRRPARAHRRPRLRPDHAAHRPHPRARAAAGGRFAGHGGAATTGRWPTSGRAPALADRRATRRTCPATPFVP